MVSSITKRGSKVLCNAVIQADPKVSSGGGMGKTLYLGLLFGLWYAFSVGFGVYNKQVCRLPPKDTNNLHTQYPLQSMPRCLALACCSLAVKLCRHDMNGPEAAYLLTALLESIPSPTLPNI